MDSGIIGSVVTVVFFVLFIAIVWWVYHKENRHKHEEAANLPFQEEDDGIDHSRGS
jgi:cytochrome c oxidase cbb3-type subunit 4